MSDVETAWFEHGNAQFEVEVGSDAHKTLAKNGAVQCAAPDDSSSGSDDLTVKELRELAKDRGVDLGGAKSKAEIQKVLDDADAFVDDAEDDELGDA